MSCKTVVVIELTQIKEAILIEAKENEPTKEELEKAFKQTIIQSPDLIPLWKNVIEKYAVTIGKLKIIVDPFIEKYTNKKNIKEEK